jgi:hypothetical protein
MRILKTATMTGLIVSVLAIIFCVTSCAHQAKPAEQPAPAPEKWPDGFAFDQIRKMKAAGLDKIYYAIFGGDRLTGWLTVEYGVGKWDGKPTATVTVTEPAGRFRQTDVTYYDADLNILAIEITREWPEGDGFAWGSSFRAARKGDKLETEFLERGSKPRKREIALGKAQPLRPFALPLRYFGRGIKPGEDVSLVEWNTDQQNVQARDGSVLMDVMGKVAHQVVVLHWGEEPAHHYTVDRGTGMVVRRGSEDRIHMRELGILFPVSRADFEKWIINGRWVEADKAIARNIAGNLLPQPGPVADWAAKRKELAKAWAEKAEKIPEATQDKIYGLERQWLGDSPEIAALKPDIITFFVAKMLDEDADWYGNESGNRLAVVWSLAKDEVTPEVREALVACMYGGYESDFVGEFLAHQCWDKEMRDILLERLENSPDIALVQALIKIFREKEPALNPILDVYAYLNTGRDGCLEIWDDCTEHPVDVRFVGIEMDRDAHMAGRMPGHYLEWPDGRDAKISAGPSERMGEFCYAWCEAVFGPEPLSDERREKAETLIKQLDSDDWRECEKAREGLMAMGPQILPLLEQEKDNESAEVRSAIQQITDAVTPRGYKEISEFVKANHYDRDLTMLINFLACQTPNLRAKAAARLKALTGEDFGEDFVKWYKWHEAHKAQIKWDEQAGRYTVSE